MTKLKLIISIFLILLSNSIFSQDTTRVKSSFYARLMPLALYTGSGSMDDKIPQFLEVGRSIGVIDVGLAYGRINQRLDSSNYMEAKVTMDACQYGRFSNEFTVGAGRVFNAKTPIMLEISTTIFAQIGDNWGIGVATGYYDFSGQYYDSSKNYYGLYIRFGLQRSDGGVLMNGRPHISHHHM